MVDVGTLPAFVNPIAPVVDDGRAVPATGDDPAQSGFGSALASALATAIGDDGQPTASSTAVEPQAMRPDLRAALRGNWDLTEAPVPSGCSEDDTPNRAAAVLGYLGSGWPPLVAPPAGAVPVGTSVEQQAAPGELSGLAAQTAPPDAAAVTAAPDVVVGVLQAPVNPPGGSRQTTHARDPRGFDLWNAPDLPAHGLRPSELLSRLGLSGGEPRPTLSALAGWAESLTAGGPAITSGAEVAADAAAVVPSTNPGARHDGTVDLAALNVGTLQGAKSVQDTLPIVNTTAPNGDLAAAVAANALAADPVVPQTAPETDGDAAGPRRGMPAFDRATLRVPPADTATAAPGDASRLEAERQLSHAFGRAQQAFQNSSTGAAPPIDTQARVVSTLPADPTVVPGQGPRLETPLASMPGVRVPPAEMATAVPRDASRLEAQRQIADAFVSAQQPVQNPPTASAPPIDARARVVPTPSPDRPTIDLRWTPGPQEDIAGSLAQAVRGIDATAGHSGTAGQSTGRDESNGRAFERRPPTELPLLYTGATRGATADLAPERTTFTDAARTMARPTTAEPRADGAPLTQALVQSLKLQWLQGGGEARLRLQPEYLGELTVSLRVQGSTVTAVLQCDSPNVRAWVETHQADLRRALEAQGLSLNTITVDPEGHPQPQQKQSQERDPQPRKWRRGEPGQFEAFL